MLRLDASM